jgi:hypothetical protein
MKEILDYFTSEVFVKTFRTPCSMIPLPNTTSLSLLLTIKTKHEDNSNTEHSVLDPTKIQDICEPEQ